MTTVAPNETRERRRVRRAALSWLITDASSEVAQALVRAVAGRGDRAVVLVADGAPFSPPISIHPGRIHLVTTDIRDQRQVDRAVAEALERLGRIDVVAITACYTATAALEEISGTQARTVFEVNVLGVLNVLRAVLPMLRTQRFGHVVQALPSYSPTPMPGSGLLTASMYATGGLADVLLVELAPLGIDVSVVETSPMITHALPASEPADPPINDYDAIINRQAHVPPEPLQHTDIDSDVAELLAAVDGQSRRPLLKTLPDAARRSPGTAGHAENASTPSPAPMLACPALSAARDPKHR